LVKLIAQGEIVADSLADYLDRHPELERYCSKNSKREFFTTDATIDFDNHARFFYGTEVQSKHVDL
jgi:glutamate racemase